ncbi:MAG: putative zinc-binding protein [Syntrophomonadaceae bacterium]|nr:putative zinc-binding protein [Syntrophomonadaceae bacterium]
MAKKVVIIPCSGIGKPYGEIGRQAVYAMAEELRPEDVTTVCLAKLMIDDPETRALVNESYVITVDGCGLACARKNVEAVGKRVDREVKVIETFKDHRDLKPEGVLELGEPGFRLAQILAEKLDQEVNCVMQREG